MVDRALGRGISWAFSPCGRGNYSRKELANPCLSSARGGVAVECKSGFRCGEYDVARRMGHRCACHGGGAVYGEGTDLAERLEEWAPHSLDPNVHLARSAEFNAQSECKVYPDQRHIRRGFLLRHLEFWQGRSPSLD